MLIKLTYVQREENDSNKRLSSKKELSCSNKVWHWLFKHEGRGKPRNPKSDPTWWDETTYMLIVLKMIQHLYQTYVNMIHDSENMIHDGLKYVYTFCYMLRALMNYYRVCCGVCCGSMYLLYIWRMFSVVDFRSEWAVRKARASLDGSHSVMDPCLHRAFVMRTPRSFWDTWLLQSKQHRTSAHQRIVVNYTNKQTKGRKREHTNLMRFSNSLRPRGRRGERSY